MHSGKRERERRFNTQPPEGGWGAMRLDGWLLPPSFNTQPPEGGWNVADTTLKQVSGFNTQPPEGGWF